MLWLCLHLPRLPLEVFARGSGGQHPGAAAVIEKEGTRERILVCNQAAQAAGVRPGQRGSAALALVPTLRLHPRRGAREARALGQLGAWCGQFSDFVHLRSPDRVLLEVRASLKLFGGLDNISLALEQGVRELGYSTAIGVAPTPLAAGLLARCGGGRLERSELHRGLGRVPADKLELPPAVLDQLQRMGVDTLAECLRLPRTGLARRLGPACVDYLDRLLGRRADPLSRFEPPARYAARIPLPAETESSEALGFPLRRLLLELCGILAGRAAGVQTLLIELAHERGPVTTLRLGLAAPTRDPAHLLMLAREQFERVKLPAPVTEVGIRAERLPALAASTGDLFSQGEPPPGEQLLDRLRLRLGEDAVDGVRCRAEHRPERAWQVSEPGAAAAGESAAPAAERPLWLLRRPLRLVCEDAVPHYDGAALALLEGPERIESGWWDGRDAARDYFVATGAGGARYWVFQELTGGRDWFLHGIFA